MDSGTYNFTFKVGTDWTQVFTMTGYNLTTYTASMTIRDHWTSDVLLTLTGGSGITLSNGSFTLAISEAQSNTLGVGKFVYDLKIESGGGIRSCIMEGTIEIRQSATV